MKKGIHANTNKKRAGVAVSDKCTISESTFQIKEYSPRIKKVLS